MVYMLLVRIPDSAFFWLCQKQDVPFVLSDEERFYRLMHFEVKIITLQSSDPMPLNVHINRPRSIPEMPQYENLPLLLS